MLDFNKAYVVSYKGGGTPGYAGIAVGIRPFREPYPPPYDHKGVGNGLEWIPNSPDWPVMRGFMDIVSDTPDRVEARARLPEFAGEEVYYVFEPLTVERMYENRAHILNFDQFVSELASDEDIQEFYLDKWLIPRPDWLSPTAEEIEHSYSTLEEAVAPVGAIHARKDGYNWQKQLNKSWVRVGRTYSGPLKPGETEIEPPEEEKEVEFGKWPKVEVPAGGTWKEEAEGFDHLVRGPRGPSTLATYYNDPVVPGDDSTIAPKPEHEERFENIWDEMHRCSGFNSNRTSPKDGRRPVAILTMGVPASGKSDAVNNVVANREGFVHIDPDEIKKLIPEYPEAVGQRAKNAAALAHAESALLAERLRNHARDQGKNFIFEGLGRDPVYYGEMIDDLKLHGYDVQIVMTHVENEDTAVARSEARGEKTGRWVDGNFIRSMVPVIPKSFAQLKDKVHGFAVFDTEEFPPKLAWSKTGDQEVVPDPELKDRLTRGELRRPRPTPEGKNVAAPPDVDLTTVIAAFMKAFEVDHAEMELTPRRFRKGQGIVMPSDDPFTKRSKTEL